MVSNSLWLDHGKLIPATSERNQKLMTQTLKRYLFISFAFIGTFATASAQASESFLRPLVGHHNLKGDAGCEDLVISYGSESYTATANGNSFLLVQLDSERSFNSMRVSGNNYQMSFTYWRDFAWTNGVHNEVKIRTNADGRNIETISATYSEPKNKADFIPSVLRRLNCSHR